MLSIQSKNSGLFNDLEKEVNLFKAVAFQNCLQLTKNSFLYSPKKVDTFNMIPNKHLSGGIVPVSLEKINGMTHIIYYLYLY